MTVSRPRAALLALLLAAVLVAAGARAAVSASPLPEVSAEELLASVLRVAQDPPPVAGELAATIGLGLPELPGEAGDSTFADLLGSNRLRLERSEDGRRIALLGEHSERLLVTDGETLTSWDSRTLEVVRWQLPADADRPAGHGDDVGRSPLAAADPLELAIPLVSALEGDAAVSVDGTARVAGRDVYRVVLAPDDPGTTLGRAELDVDAQTRMPLRTALFARGASAASVEMAFTSVSFAPIDPTVFDFTPPPGAVVTEREVGDATAGADGLHHPGWPGPDRDAGAGERATRVVGDGWTAVAVLPLPEDLPPEARALLPLDGPLLSVRAAEADGAPVLLTGLVPLSRLDEVAAELR